MITTQQQVMAGVYNAFPNSVSKFFTRRIKKSGMPFMTNVKTIVYEEVENHVIAAKILKRGEKFPTAKLDGSVVKSVTPEVIKESIPFDNAESEINRKPGDNIVWVNGVAVNNAEYERDRRVQTCRLSVDTTTERISASVFLKNMYKSGDTKNTISYPNYGTVNIASTAITDYGIWLTEKMNERQLATGSMVEEVLVGSKVFYNIISRYNANQNNAIRVEPTRISTPDGYELTINLFGMAITMIPPALDAEGTAIDTSNWIMMVNYKTWLPAYAGVKNVINGISTYESIDVLVRETAAEEETGNAKTLAESAWCPIVVNPTLTYIYKVTGLV